MMYPNEYLQKKWSQISEQVKVTFVSSIIIGLITHLYMFTNFLPNHDSLGIQDNGLWIITQGRWFSFIIAYLTGRGFLLPWLIGLLSILFISLSAALIVNIINIQSKVNCVLISGLLCSFPAVTSFNNYIMGVHGFYFSVLLMIFAIYITLKYKFGFLAGILCIACSLAIYQANFSFACCLTIIILIIDILKNELNEKEIIIKGIKYLLTLLFGIILYFIITKIVLYITKIELSSYQGISEMGNYPISRIPFFIKQAFKSIIDFYLNNNINGKVISMFYFLIFITSSVLLVNNIIQGKLYNNKNKTLLLCILLFLIPIACNIVYLFNASYIYLNMIYGIVLIPITCILIIDIIQNQNIKEKNYLKYFKYTAAWFISLFFIICIYNYIITANKIYTKMHLVYEKSYAYSTNLISRIESTEGYTNNSQIFFYGRPGGTINQYHDYNDLNSFIGATVNLSSSYSNIYFLHNFIGYKSLGEITIDDPDGGFFSFHRSIESLDIDHDELKNMPIYPEPGSIKKINDIMVVKFRNIKCLN